MNQYRAQLYDRADELLARLLKAEDRDYRVVLVELAADIVGELRATERAIVLPPSPALEQWRQRTLEARSADALTRAAAWELTAVACDQSDARDLAEKARRNASYALGVRNGATTAHHTLCAPS